MKRQFFVFLAIVCASAGLFPGSLSGQGTIMQGSLCFSTNGILVVTTNDQKICEIFAGWDVVDPATVRVNSVDGYIMTDRVNIYLHMTKGFNIQDKRVISYNVKYKTDIEIIKIAISNFLNRQKKDKSSSGSGPSAGPQRIPDVSKKGEPTWA